MFVTLGGGPSVYHRTALAKQLGNSVPASGFVLDLFTLIRNRQRPVRRPMKRTKDDSEEQINQVANNDGSQRETYDSSDFSANPHNKFHFESDLAEYLINPVVVSFKIFILVVLLV